jgi:hypothetical protein
MMKNILNFVIILIFLSFFSCNKDYSPLGTLQSEFSSADDSNIPQLIRSKYKLDAALLALGHMYRNKLPDTASVYIPEYLIQPFYSGLIRIYNCRTIPFTKSITKTRPIHTRANQILYSVSVGIDTSYDWTKRWVDGFKYTGNDTIDSLLVKYNLESHTTYAIYRSVNLYSEKPLNIMYLITLLEEIPGITYAEPRVLIGGGNYITARMESSYIKFRFYMGWGDCPSGCLYGHSWEYTVSYGGEVRFLSSYGDDLDLEP